MIRKSLIALSAAAVLGMGMAATASTAEAKTHINLNLGFGFGGYGGGYYPVDDYGYDEPFYGGCGYQWVAYKKWNPWHTHYVIRHKQVPVCY